MRRVRSRRAEAVLERSFAFEPALRAQLKRDIGDIALIEELLQEVYARLLTAAEAGPVRAHHLRTAIFDILVEVLRAVPRDPALPASSTQCAVDPALTPTGTETERDELRHLIALAATFPTPMRQVFTLRKVYDHPVDDIARALGLTEPEVERHLIAAALACARNCFDPNPTHPDANSIPGSLKTIAVRTDSSHAHESPSNRSDPQGE